VWTRHSGGAAQPGIEGLDRPPSFPHAQEGKQMKRHIFPVLFFLALCGNLNGKEINFAIGEWAPYTSEKIPGFGAFTEIVSAACKEAGLTPKFLFYPWKRAEFSVQEGISFATFPYSITDEKKEIFYFSDPVMESATSVMKFAGNKSTRSFKFESMADLKPFMIGFTVGDAHEKTLRGADIAFETTQVIDLSLRKLEGGRIDLIIEDRLVSDDAIKRLYPEKIDQFVFEKKNFTDGIIYRVMASKKYPESRALLDKFNEGLARIRKNGTLERIYKKHGISAPHRS
jgi:polar amino acid transport system substrate-binding protein